MSRCDKDVIIEKAIELGKLLANSDILNDLREAEIAFLNDKEAQFLLEDIKKLKKNGDKKEAGNLRLKLLKLDSYRRLLEAQETSKKLIDEIHGILNYYINGTLPKCDGNSCANCSRRCMSNE
ncbi:YlbF family regulator [Thermoanaerobacterium thermosaccharolyticum]|uniref:YlbF family regulator n=1 Tax=Thermoanaerobacterium thermosaccharolyticum TaxID=1517 RepID=UPI0020A4107F|nr:cell fate (sporulation/competence/biofilm development) regulator YlbF (YheA/YmcA/DUF963 family) [Thermoanaerobacterium thermosaccharolyticum]